MTQAEFFAWAEAQQGRYEFDGVQPVAMTGGTVNHSRIAGNNVVVEQDSMAMTVYSRPHREAWQAVALTETDTLALPEIGVELPIAGFYEGVSFSQPEDR